MGDMRLASIRETEPNTAVTLRPEWAALEQERLAASRHRTEDGRLYTYTWGRYPAFRVPLRFVAGGARERIGRWWHDRERLLLTLDTSVAHSSVVCRVSGRSEPLGHRVAPQADLWAGVLELLAVDGRGRLGRPFILDDPSDGRLDQPDLSLI